MLDYGFFDDPEPEQGLTVEDSSDLFPSDDLSPGMMSTGDASNLFPSGDLSSGMTSMGDAFNLFPSGDLSSGMTSMEDASNPFASDDLSLGTISLDTAMDDPNSANFISAANGCGFNMDNLSPTGKTRRGELCPGTEDYTNEKPFVLPSILLDVMTVKTEKYCPLEKFDESSQYLVCSSGFAPDVLFYGLVYFALLNGELGRYSFACTARVIPIFEDIVYAQEEI